jgi:hypothetical protein
MPAPVTTIQRRDLGDVVSEYALERSRDSFVGLRLMPEFRVALQSGNYPIIPIEQMLKPRDVKRSAKSGYNRGDWGFEQGDYTTVEYGWEEIISDSDSRNYQTYFDGEVMAARLATDVILRAQESRIATVAAAQTAHAASVKWSTAATATPRANVTAGTKALNQATGMLPNAFILTWQTFQYLLATTEIRNATQYTGDINMKGLEAQKQMIAAYFGVSEVIIANAVTNSSKEGATAGFVASQIWDDANGYLAITGAGSIESSPAFGRSMLWTDDSPNIVTVESYREDRVRGSVIRARQHVVEKVLNAACIYRISNLA